MKEQTALMTAPFVLAYPYKRSLGPVMGRFFTALQACRIEGVRTPSGRVLVPPTEYDPETGEDVVDVVEVGPAGTVNSWTWVSSPHPNHPLQHPFAFALIQLDGADTSMLHAVSVEDSEKMHVGMRVKPQWRDERGRGLIDIISFVPEDTALPDPAPAPEDAEAITRFTSPTRLDYTITASPRLTTFLAAVMKQELLGWRCEQCQKVFIPPRGACPTCGVPLIEPSIPLSQTGTVKTFCVVRFPFEGQVLKPPYACAHILLDGADVELLHLVGGCPVEDVKIGMRVHAKWSDNPTPSLESLLYFTPVESP